MIDAEKRDFDDATPVAALENGGIDPFVGDAGMFHDVPLVDAQTDSELARAYLLHAELAPTTLKSTTTEVGRFLLWCQGHGKVLAAIRVEDLLGFCRIVERETDFSVPGMAPDYTGRIFPASA